MKIDSFPLETPHVRLERLSEAHREPSRLCGGAQAMFEGLPMVEGCAGFDAYFSHMLREGASGQSIPLAVTRRGDASFAGVVAFLEVSKPHRRVRIGHIWHPPELRGRGLFRATQLAMLERAFTAGARRVEWHIDAEHADLTGALTRLGASADGILRQWQKRADGVWADIAVFSLLRSEWPAVQARLTAALAELATAA